MKVLKRAQIVKLEKRAVERGISLSALMKNAGMAVAEEAIKMLGKNDKAAILCGKGNNGGDGFVCAAELSSMGYDVSVILAFSEPEEGIAAEYYRAMPEEVAKCFKSQEAPKAIAGAGLIIDAIFGFGFKGVVTGRAEELIALANAANARRLAVDIPSGVECDTAAVRGTAFVADKTISFHSLKPANISLPGMEYCGEVAVAAVGIEADEIGAQPELVRLMDSCKAAGIIKLRKIDANKGDFGRLLLVCGSYGMAGACIMAGKAALRSGVGLLQVFLDKSIYEIVASQLPEAVFYPVDMENMNEAEDKLKLALSKCTVCAAGCGLGEDSERLCSVLFDYCRVPLLLDADALNFISRHPESLGKISCDMVWTPHPGEMSRLMGLTVSEIQSQRISVAAEAASKYNCVLLLKGAVTVIADKDGRLYVNTTGNPGMARGGSGDTLAGIIAALMAQGIDCFEAAALGAHIHGLSGDRCAELYSQHSMLPTDMIETLPEIFSGLEAQHKQSEEIYT